MRTTARSQAFFKAYPRIYTPLPIRWTARAKLPKKRAKRGPGRPRKIREDEIQVIEIDQESGKSDGEICTGEGELPLAKTKCMYTMYQKKRVLAVARNESVTAASKHFKIPRTSINRWMAGSYFDVECAKGRKLISTWTATHN